MKDGRVYLLQHFHCLLLVGLDPIEVVSCASAHIRIRRATVAEEEADNADKDARVIHNSSAGIAPTDALFLSARQAQGGVVAVAGSQLAVGFAQRVEVGLLQLVIGGAIELLTPAGNVDGCAIGWHLLLILASLLCGFWQRNRTDAFGEGQRFFKGQQGKIMQEVSV